MSDVIRVIVADDHPIYRDGVARTLAEVPGIEVVAQASDGAQALDLTRQLKPDLVLLDISMPQGGGIEALRRIMSLAAPPRVAMLTASEDEGDLMEALRNGAHGYILKGVGSGELIRLVRDLANGKSYVAPGLAAQLLIAMRSGTDAPSPDRKEADPLAELTRREEDILKLVASGKSNKEVGRALDLQEKTVKHYMTSILQKLGVRNRVEAAMLATGRMKGD